MALPPPASGPLLAEHLEHISNSILLTVDAKLADLKSQIDDGIMNVKNEMMTETTEAVAEAKEEMVADMRVHITQIVSTNVNNEISNLNTSLLANMATARAEAEKSMHDLFDASSRVQDVLKARLEEATSKIEAMVIDNDTVSKKLEALSDKFEVSMKQVYKDVDVEVTKRTDKLRKDVTDEVKRETLKLGTDFGRYWPRTGEAGLMATVR